MGCFLYKRRISCIEGKFRITYARSPGNDDRFFEKTAIDVIDTIKSCSSTDVLDASSFDPASEAAKMGSSREVVLDFGPVCSLIKMDQVFI